MNDISRRQIMSGCAGLALLGVFPRSSAAQFVCCMPDELRDRIRDLLTCARRYRELDSHDIDDARSNRAWQSSYDCLVAAGDAVRNAITDATPGKDAAIELARNVIRPSCDRAYMYWQPISGISASYRPLASAFFAARTELACSYGCPWRSGDDPVDLTRTLMDASHALREAIPRNASDRQVARRVIESLSNDDMVDVSIVRSTMPMDDAAYDFACWAQPCGAFTCEHCNQWLGKVEEGGIWL